MSRLRESAVALALEADVNVLLEKLDYKEQRGYDGVDVLYPFETRGAEVVVVPARSFRRADDLVAVLGSRTMMSAAERAGLEVPGRAAYPRSKRLDAVRPTIRYDLPPPTPARLRQLRAIARTAATKPAAP